MEKIYPCKLLKGGEGAIANWSLYSRKLNVEGDSYKERQIDSVRRAVLDDFDYSPSHRIAYFNGTNKPVDIHMLDDRSDYIKTIMMKPYESIKAGDVLNIDGDNWLCISADNTDPINESGMVYLCTHTISLYKNGILYEHPIAIESGIRLYQLGESDGKYFSEPSTVVTARLPQNDITSSVSRGQVYTIGSQNWKVTDVNGIIEPNILILRLEWTAEKPKTPDEPTPIQPIQIEGKDSIIFGKTATYTVNYPEEVVFEIEGEFANIESQGDNQCIVKAGQKYGYARLVAKYNGVEGYKEILIRNIF